MSVCLSPLFERSPAMTDKGEPRVFIVGASHAARLAEQMSAMAKVDCVSSSGWRAGKTSGEALASALS
jgi:hypothetical protein